MLAWVLAVVVVLVAALLAFGIAALLHLQGAAYLIFVIALLLIGIAAAITILVFHYRAKKDKELEGEAGPAGGAGDIDLLLNDANRKLRTSQQGAKALDALPLIYILGDAGSAKTTTVAQSGLDPELLSGSATAATDQTPTQVLNLWFARQAAFLEIGAAVRDSKSLFERLVHRTRAKAYRSAFGTGAAARAVIVCLSTDQLLVADAGVSLMASARSTGAQLRELSRLLGMPIPVYVIVTKLDRVPHFDQYARNLTDEEVRQVFGTPLARSDASVGTYSEQASRILAAAIDGLIYQLGEFRVEMLDRENDAGNTPGVYEFPREFGKIRKGLNQYLVELCKPSQLSANPYLRGLFFTGVRARVVERAANASVASERLAPQEVDAGATQYLNLSRAQAGAAARTAAPVMVSARVPQWTFLPRLLPEVILGDKSALAATRQTAPARLFRRILYGTFAFLLAFWCLFLVVSYVNNAAIKHRIERGAHTLPHAAANSISLPSLSDLRALDDLRQLILQLDDYRQNGAPLRYRFGLYQGNSYNADARRVYFDRFRTMMLNPAQGRMLAFMGTLPPAPPQNAANDAGLFNAAYNPLKTYLITTTQYNEKSQPPFQTPVLVQYWIGSGQVDDESRRLATAQFDFYGAELLARHPYDITADTATVQHTQSYLANFVGNTRIYQAMLSDADKASPPIDFNHQYPGSADYILEPKIIRGAYSRDGFAAMQEALKHPDKYANGDKWVLGSPTGTFNAPAAGNTDFAAQYSGEFLREWMAFIGSAHLTSCGTLQEAPARLGVLGGGSSPLLQWFFVVSHNTAVADQQIAAAFQPAHKFVNSDAKGTLIGDANKPYFEALLQLGSQIDLAVKTNPNVLTDATAFTPISGAAVTASNTADQAGLTFDPDQQTHTTATFLKMLKAPIDCVTKDEPSPGAAANGSGQKLCAALAPLLAKYPFNRNSTQQASVREVDAFFAPQTGALAAAYDGGLNKILVPAGSRYEQAPTSPGKVNPRFATLFSNLEHISSALYAGGAKSATMNFSLRWVPTNGVSNATIVIDGQRTSGTSEQKYVWTGITAQNASISSESIEAPSQGPWAVFQLVRRAKHITPTGGGYRLEYSFDINLAGVNGTTKPVTFELQGPGAEFLAGDGLSGLGCVQPVILK